MKRKAYCVLLSAVAVMLAPTICYEVIHLVDHHIRVDVAYQQEVLSGINEASQKVSSADGVEDLIKRFNAKDPYFLSKEQITRELPRRKQGRYTAYVRGEVLDWACYDIEPLCDYSGWLEIGMEHGDVKTVRLIYTSIGE